MAESNKVFSVLTPTDVFSFLGIISFSDCQSGLIPWGLVNSLELALICIRARVKSTGVPQKIKQPIIRCD